MNPTLNDLTAQILDALPQTQCTRCGYPDCTAYAAAISQGDANINQCPPGGAEGIARLARITGKQVLALNPDYGQEVPRTVAFVDENWCIGCTLCINACPTDAIVGSNKRMHTVIEKYCTGCELCIPVCPVDCIHLENISEEATGWSAWSAPQADEARQRYAARQLRQQRESEAHARQQEEKVRDKLTDLAEHSQITDPTLLDKKRKLIEAALARAKERKVIKTQV